MKKYTVLHTNEKAAEMHAKKIRQRCGTVQGEKKNGRFQLSYSFPNKSKSGYNVTAKSSSELIIQSLKIGSSKVKVVFYPEFEASKHSFLTNKKLIQILKKSKVSIFDVVEESSDIVKLVNDPSVKEIVFIKD